jgi:hypothetical protein
MRGRKCLGGIEPLATETPAGDRRPVLPAQTLRWLIRRSVRLLRLPSLAGVAPPHSLAVDEPEEPWADPANLAIDDAPAPADGVVVYFLDAGAPATERPAKVRMEVLSMGPGGEVLLAEFAPDGRPLAA